MDEAPALPPRRRSPLREPNLQDPLEVKRSRRGEPQRRHGNWDYDMSGQKNISSRPTASQVYAQLKDREALEGMEGSDNGNERERNVRFLNDIPETNSDRQRLPARMTKVDITREVRRSGNPGYSQRQPSRASTGDGSSLSRRENIVDFQQSGSSVGSHDTYTVSQSEEGRHEENGIGSRRVRKALKDLGSSSGRLNSILQTVVLMMLMGCISFYQL